MLFFCQKFSRIWFHTFSFLLFGITQILMAHVIDFYGLAMLIGVLGICDGIYLSCLIPIVLEIANCPKLTNQLSGYYHSIISIPVILGPALSGMFFEKYQNYTYAFYLGGSCCLLCSLILLFNPGTLLSKCRFVAKVGYFL